MYTFNLNQTTDRKYENKDCFNELNESKFWLVQKLCQIMQKWWKETEQNKWNSWWYSVDFSYLFCIERQDKIQFEMTNPMIMTT